MGIISFCCFVLMVFFFGCFNKLSHGTIDLWRNRNGSAEGILYYKIYDRFDTHIQQTIQQTIDDFNELLNYGGSRCIQFKVTNGLQAIPYVNFKFAPTSSDSIIPNPGMTSGKYKMDIPVNINCVDRRKLVYSLARILGLPDEHTRPDRDKFLTIHWDNLEEKYRARYNISSYDIWDKICQMPYDFTSATHAGPFEHALDTRKPTISSKYPGVYFGDHYNLSVIDVRKLRALYGCSPGTDNQRFNEHRPVHCTFDLPLCGMVNDWTSPDAKWTERKGPVSMRGPQTDHSNGAGKYMFLNGSDTVRTASLVSVREISPGPVCVSLYYYMEHNCTTLNISQRESTGGQTTTIKKIVGSNETSWSEVLFNMTATTAWRILIKVSTEEGEVAIDDVTVQYGDCPQYDTCWKR